MRMTTSRALGMLLTSWFAGSIAVLPEAVYAGAAAGETLLASASMVAQTAPEPMQAAADWRIRQGPYYKRNWGVEVIGVHPVSSGFMLAFRYRVLDANKAKPVNDLKDKAYLIDEATHTRLAVPALENVGELRSGAAPQAERSYFMVFGNPGRLVKVGSRVSVVIGKFHVDDIIVN